MESLPLVFGEKATVPGYIGADVQMEVINHLWEVKPDKILLVCDSGAYAHHPDYFAPLFKETSAAPGETGETAIDGQPSPEVVKYMLPEGDACKSWNHIGSLMRWAFDIGSTQRSLVVGFGGGALLNVAGFFASILFRGSKLIYIPTTFLAMHDVVTSLETSICCNGGKNNIGSFYTPLKILIDIGFCRTLPRRELFSGLGELAKNALLLGGKFAAGFSAALSKEQVDAAHGCSGAELMMDDRTLLTLVNLGIEAKMSKQTTKIDEKARGMLFEYGHTIAHAIEQAYGDGVIPHGVGVAYGMLSSSYAAERLGGMTPEDRKEHDALCWLLLKRWPLPEPKPTVEKVMGFALRDSKRGITGENEDEISDVLMVRMGEFVSTDTKNLSKFPSKLLSKWLYSMGFPHEGSIQTVGQDSEAITEECKALLDAVRISSDSDLVGMGFEPLTVGFANHVWSTTKRDQSLVIKRYTDLAFMRLDAEAIGCVDVYSGERGIGPRVLYSSPQGLVMELLDGCTLEEADMHSNDFDLLDIVAKVLAEYHQLPIPAVCGGSPMLWRTIDGMVDVASRKPELWPEEMPSIDVVTNEVSRARAALAKHEPDIVLCHGDLKPSNVFLKKNGEVKIIDHELAGPNYRAFDLMKIFRTGAKHSDASMEHFLCTYAKTIGRFQSEDDVASILEEVKMFEPLTWLEAACFFLALPQFKPQDTSRWNSLALDRWKKYEATKELLLL